MAEEIREEPIRIPKSDAQAEFDTASVSSLSPDNRGYKSTGTYIYTTDKAVEKFGDVKFNPPIRPRNNLNAPPQYIQPPQSEQVEKNKDMDAWCKKNPTSPKCQDRPRPSHDEHDIYSELGFFAEEHKGLFTPESRIEKQKAKSKEVKKPVANLYEQGSDDIQLQNPTIIRSECRCKDGRKVLGYLNTRNGQKDCSACDQKTFQNPNVYKNYQTKKKRAFSPKPPLRQQIGVSTFGDVDMKGCQTQKQTSKQIKRINAGKTLNNITSTVQSRGTRVTTDNATPINPSSRAFSIYDNCNTNIYGI